jgi:hypothetical protein
MKLSSANLLQLFSVVAVSACAGPASVNGDFDPILPFGPESPWTARPSLEDARRIIPPMVLATRELQSVFLRCKIAASGRLADCEVDHESRSGIGLGNAALEAAGLSSLKPVLTNGEPSAGRFVSVSMNFDVGGAVDRTDFGGIYPFLIDLSDSNPGPVILLSPARSKIR